MRTSLLASVAFAFLALGLAGCPGTLDPIDCKQCADHTTCEPGVSLTCDCADGFAGDGTAAGTGCSDIDECAVGGHDCAANGTCSNTVGGWECGCPAGFDGDGTAGGTGCTDIDECAAGTDDCAGNATCNNTPGSFTCECAAGYEGDGTATGTGCVDIDECARDTDTCVGDNDGGLCTNTPGSFTCACDEDNDGNGIPTEDGGTGCTEKPTNPRLTIPRRMPNDKSITVRADILTAIGGKVVTTGCFGTLGAVRMTRISDGADIPITMTQFDDHIAAPADSIRFYHGIGSVSFTLDGGAQVPAGAYRVTVTVGQLRASRVVHVLNQPTWREMPAHLDGADLVWGPHENIRIKLHDTEIPAGKTLTIHPGTLIMVDTTGSVENGTLITVNGQIDAAGTLARPIHWFSERGPRAMIHTVSGSLSNVDAWRGIFFYGNGSSTMKHWVLTGAGNGQVISHPRPPIINLFGTHRLVAEDGVYVDSTGMMFSSPGNGNYQLRRNLISRVGIGAEFLSSGNTLLVEDTWWTSIGRGPSTPVRYDGDALHVDGAGSNQMIRGNIIADVGDDCIDHSNSTFTVEGSIIHDCNDKAISLTNGSMTLRNSLLFNAPTGVRGTARVYNSTIATGSPIATVEVLQDSIIWPQSVPSCTGMVNYSILGSAGDLGCGMGNRSVDPRFTNVGQCNFNPAQGSPALTGGSMGGRVGWQSFASF